AATDDANIISLAGAGAVGVAPSLLVGVAVAIGAAISVNNIISLTNALTASTLLGTGLSLGISLDDILAAPTQLIDSILNGLLAQSPDLASVVELLPSVADVL